MSPSPDAALNACGEKPPHPRPLAATSPPSMGARCEDRPSLEHLAPILGGEVAVRSTAGEGASFSPRLADAALKLTRRQAVIAGGLGTAGLSLPGLLAAEENARPRQAK